MADDIASSLAELTAPYDPTQAPPPTRITVRKPRPAPPEAWSPDAVPTAEGPAPVMPSLAENLSRSTVLPPLPAQPDQAMPLGASPDPRAWQFQPPPQAEARSYQGAPVENLPYDVGRALEAVGVPADKAYDRGQNVKNILGVLPGTSSPMSIAEAKEDVAKGHYGSAAIDVIGAAPVPGAAVAKTVAKKGVKAVKEAVAGAAEGETKSVLATAGRAKKPKEAATLKEAVAIAGQEAAAKGAADEITKSAKLPNLREMDLPSAIGAARKEQHLNIKRKDGGIEGAPAHVMTKDDVLALRAGMDQAAELGVRVGGEKWYSKGREFVTQAAGPDPVTQDITANALGITSKQVNPDVNLGFTTLGTNAWAAGRPASRLMDDPEAIAYNAMRAQGKVPDTMKTAQLGINVNPTVPFTTTGVNDIWHARSMGYTNPNGSPYNGTPSGPMHRFMDHETVLAVDRANQIKLGGRDDWTAPEMQAAIWVGKKAQNDVAARIASNAEKVAKGKTPLPELTLDQALQTASKGYGEYAPKYTAHANYEFTPGQGIAGHLQGLAYGSEADRAKFAALPGNQWMVGPNKDDVLYNAAGMLQAKPTAPMQGIFSRGEGFPTELNPGFTAHPMVAMEGDTGKRVWDQNTSDLLHAVEGIRGYFDVQNASGAHQLVKNQPGRASSFVFDKSRPLTAADIDAFQAAGAKVGKPNLMDLPDRSVLTNWIDPGPGLSTKQETSLADEIAKITGSGVAPGRRVEKLSTDYPTLDRSGDWAQGEGSGAATRSLMDIVNKVPAIVANIDRDPRLRDMIKAKMDAHEAWAIANNDPIRRDIQNAKMVFSQPGEAGGLAGLFAALKAGKIALPAVAGATVALPMLLHSLGGAPGAPPPSADRS